MKIGFLTQYYPPEMGAPQARLSELARHFVRRGHQVSVLTAMPNYPTGRVFAGYGGFYRSEQRDGISVRRTWIYATKKARMVPRMINYCSFVASSMVCGPAALGRLDYLLTESPPLFLGLSGYFLSRVSRARWIFNVSDLWPESAVRLRVIGEGRLLRSAYALEAFCYRKSWLVTGQSREILDSVTRRFPSTSVYHLSNGVDTAVFRPELRCPEVRRQLGPENVCVAIYAGLHGIAQGLDQILTVAAYLRHRSDLRFVFVGDGPEREALISRSRSMKLDNVRFLEPVEKQRMPQLIASADIALVPLKENLPGAVPSKIYEAMAAGLPVVLAANGEAAGILTGAGAGIAVTPGDCDALAGAVARLAGDRDLRTSLGANGRSASEQRFDRTDIANRFIDKLEQASD
jgi:colanic acid biosynthesis glycosyl transferase WcaI